jgi:membrane protease YdiL (CAAX protease family)
MNPVARLLGSRLACAGLGLWLVARAPIAAPAPRLGLAGALVGAGAVGVATFGLLARRGPPRLGRPSVARAVALALPIVVVGAATEEAIWRFGVLRGLEPVLGPAGALTASTAGFTLAHLGQGPLRGRVVTGASFGLVYLASGRLSAAVAAHAVYNLLVIGACAAWTRAAVEAAPT